MPLTPAPIVWPRLPLATAHCALFVTGPKAAIPDAVGGEEIRRVTGEVGIFKLAPNSSLVPHTGNSNVRLTAHLGLQNAACVVVFMSQKYQDSNNCKLELTYAKQSGVPIVPVIMEETQEWRPSGWLGAVVAGLSWTTLRSEAEIESNLGSLDIGQRTPVCLPAHEHLGTARSGNVGDGLDVVMPGLEPCNHHTEEE